MTLGFALQCGGKLGERRLQVWDCPAEERRQQPGKGLGHREFNRGAQVARVDVDFLSGPKPTGTFQPASEALAAEKALFGSSRLERWFSNRSEALAGSH